MKVTYSNGKFSTDFEASNHTAIFEQVATFQEVFEETECGECQSKDLKFLVRKVTKGTKTYKYYEMLCKKCFSRLSFGIHEDFTMYPKRSKTDKDGKVVKDATGKSSRLGKNGWHKFNPNEVLEDKAEEKDGGF